MIYQPLDFICGNVVLNGDQISHLSLFVASGEKSLEILDGESKIGVSLGRLESQHSTVQLTVFEARN